MLFINFAQFHEYGKLSSILILVGKLSLILKTENGKFFPVENS